MVGLCAQVLKLGPSIDLFLWRQFLRPGKNLKEKYGTWAAVTGATDAIGRGYAEQLAKQGAFLSSFLVFH